MDEIFGQIEKILVNRDLKPQIPIDETALVDDRRFLVIPCKDRQKGKWLFKIQVLQLEGLGKSFQNEVHFLSFAQKTKVASFVPKLLDAGELEGNVWYLREFISGRTLADSEEIFPYNPRILSTVDPALAARFFYELSRISAKRALKAIPQIKRYDRKWRSYYWRFLNTNPLVLRNLKAGKINYLTSNQQKKLLNLLLSPPEKILSDWGWALNHANLSPMNIVVTTQARPIFIDWENICVGFGTSGFSEFWYRSLCSPDWQEKFFQERLSLEKNKDGFLRIFYFSLVFSNIGLGDYFNQLFKAGKLSQSDYRLAYRMWSKVMGEAVEGLARSIE